jgi:hypothetical protein
VLEIYPVAPDQYTDLSVFLSEFPDETRPVNFWVRRFNRWWDSNPAFAPDTQRGWVLRQSGGIVGFLGMVPSKFQLLGEETRAFSTTTWRVSPKYRNHSLQLFAKMMRTAKNSVLFCTTSNDHVEKMLQPLRFQPIPRLENNSIADSVKRSAIITDSGNFLRAKARRKLHSELLGKMVVPPLIPALRVFQACRFGNSLTKDVASVKQVKSADSLFDRLWARTKNGYLNTNVRTADVLNWYCCFQDTDTDYEKELFGYFRNKELLGYGIFWRRQREQLRVLECLDLWVDPDEEQAIPSLVSFARAYACENALDLVVFPDFTRTLKESLARLGLLRLPFPRRREYFKADAQISTEINASNSYLVFQGDHGL